MSGLGRQRNSSHDMLGFVFILNKKVFEIIPKALKNGVRIDNEEKHHMLLVYKMHHRYFTEYDRFHRVTKRGVYTHYEEEAKQLIRAAHWLTRMGAIVNKETDLPQDLEYDVATLSRKQMLPDNTYEQLAEQLREVTSTGQREGQ